MILGAIKLEDSLSNLSNLLQKVKLNEMIGPFGPTKEILLMRWFIEVGS
jgi:hypothetical protein